MFKFLCLILLFSCSTQKVRIAPSFYDRSVHESEGREMAIASQGEFTSKAAAQMFEEGGNIIDAFVAASFVVSVERPQSTGIGGGGFLLYYSQEEKKAYAIDFREVAPLRAHKNIYLDREGNPRPMLSREGGLAVATPGLVKGLWEIHQRWGKLPWSSTVAPAIALAEQGFPLYPHLHRAITYREELLKKDPSARKIFFTQDGKIPELGYLIIQKDLAKTLKRISAQGARGFYQGPVAKNIVETIRKRKGIMSQKDLDSYQVIEREPVSTEYQGRMVHSFPPPSSGGVHVIQILKMLEPFNLKSIRPQTTKATHLTALAMQRAFLDRSLYLGDPDFNTVLTKSLINGKYIERLSKSIDEARALSADELKMIPLPKESTETTHFSIADKEGNMVASTQTINGYFGSGVIAKDTGIILNNEMDDFAQKVGAKNLFGAVGGKNNLVEPQKRPLSSMSPTIVTENDKAIMAVGSPSGTRIISCVAQTLLNFLEYQMPLYESVAATRIHHQYQPDELKVEQPLLSTKVMRELKARGHNVTEGSLGCSVQAVSRDGKVLKAVSDPRNEGLGLSK
ncbi:MAG: gamma-glutamyltransferase [Bacteriovoracaceae bacterium]